MAARRLATLAELAARPFDLLIVGGGATGAATARDAALRGLEVGLVDAGDFAGETSSRSSKLIHGGLRYLQYGNLPLVFEGLTERGRLMRIAPHLCRPIEFLFPAYRGESPGLAALGIGVALYNALALWRAPARTRRISARELYGIAPTCAAPASPGRAATSTARPTTRASCSRTCSTPKRPARPSPTTSRPTPLVGDRRGRVRGASLIDVETGARLEAQARVVVSAAGPFTDSLLAGSAARRLRPTLGVHLVFDAARVPHGGRALVLRTPRDNRLFFVLPAGARTIVGTTDTDWSPPGIRPDRRGSATTCARAATTSPTCSRPPTTPSPRSRSAPTTCCRPTPACARCSPRPPTPPPRPRASTRSSAPPTACSASSAAS